MEEERERERERERESLREGLGTGLEKGTEMEELSLRAPERRKDVGTERGMEGLPEWGAIGKKG